MLSSLFRQFVHEVIAAGVSRRAPAVAVFVLLAGGLLGEEAVRAACGRYVVYEGPGLAGHAAAPGVPLVGMPESSSEIASLRFLRPLRWIDGRAIAPDTRPGLSSFRVAPFAAFTRFVFDGRAEAGHVNPRTGRTAPCDGPRCGGLPLGASPDSPAPIPPTLPQQWAALLADGWMQPSTGRSLPGSGDARPRTGFQWEIDRPPRGPIGSC